MGISVGDLLSMDFFKDFHVIAGHKGLNREIHDIRMNCFPSSFSKYLVFKNLIPVPKTPLGSY